MAQQLAPVRLRNVSKTFVPLPCNTPEEVLQHVLANAGLSKAFIRACRTSYSVAQMRQDTKTPDLKPDEMCEFDVSKLLPPALERLAALVKGGRIEVCSSEL